ncbi:MAG: hypothetical protein ACRCYY_14140 [Trueperaceae bacterium]
MKQEKNFGSFRISADGRVFVRDLALLQALRDDFAQDALHERVATDAVHVTSAEHVAIMHHKPSSYTTLA